MTSVTNTITVKELLATKPAWAATALIAEYEEDKSDSMTDYFATSTTRRVFLGWSKHNRDLFPEMRKAAALFSETAHLGPGKGLFTPKVVATVDIVSNGSTCWTGSWSPWHREEPNGMTFETLVEAEAAIAKAGKPHDIGFGDKVGTFAWKISTERIEHREKYSMGAGYYLKASGRYSSGWTVGKSNYFGGENGTIEVLVTEKANTSTAVPVSEPASGPVGVTVTLNVEKNGVEIRFPAKPSDSIRTALKANGWRWSRFSGCWYRKDTPAARTFANGLATETVEAA